MDKRVSSNDDWQQKYSHILSEFEKKDLDHETQLAELRQGLSRLCVAAHGVNPQLDRSLSKLRTAIRQGHEHAVIVQNFDEIATVIKEMDRLKTEKSEPILAKNQNSSEAPVQIPQGELDCLMEMLENISIPAKLAPDVNMLAKKLSKGFPSSDLLSILSDLKKLVIEAFKSEQNKIKEYLGSLNARLQDVQNFLTNSNGDQEKHQNESNELQAAVRQQVTGIQQSMRVADSLDQLAGSIESNLGTIMNRMDTFQEQERKRTEEAKNKIGILEKELYQTQSIAADLQNTLTETVFLSQRDALTGLMNRKAYDDAMQRAYARWQRFQDNLVIVVADIDKFKHINDTFGHQAGDKVLEKVGYILGISFREYDIVARYGGEEFVTVMDKVTLENAHKVVERVRQTIEKCNFHYSNKPVPVTISFGIAKFRQGDDIETVFKRADDALYKAKNAGRNQVKIG